MRNITRRNIVTTTVIAATGLSAIPFAAAAMVPDPEATDAQLLALSAELEAISREWHARRTLEARRDAAFDAACEDAGLPKIECASVPFHEWSEYVDKRHQIGLAADKEFAREQEEEKATHISVWDRFHERSYPLCEKILSLRATTLAGLAVQAGAITLSEHQSWGYEYRDDDPIRKFIDSICAFAHVTPLPLTLPENVS